MIPVRDSVRSIAISLAGSAADSAAGDIPVVHESVVFRMATGFQGYAPIALPHIVQITTINREDVWNTQSNR